MGRWGIRRKGGGSHGARNCAAQRSGQVLAGKRADNRAPMNALNTIQTIAVYLLPVLFGITLHEAAHGWAALRLGDETARRAGRVTLNPLRHIDPIGTIVMPLLLYVATAGSFVFGYAKPVPVNFMRLRNPRRDMALVALAGPASNFAMAFAWALLGTVLLALGLREPFFIFMCQAGVSVNLALLALNLFPLPPLDGSRVLISVLPPRFALWLARVEPWGFYIVLALIFTGVFSRGWMLPLMQASGRLLRVLIRPIAALLH